MAPVVMSCTRVVKEIEPVIRSSGPGRYVVDELPIKPFPSGHTCRGWGVAIKKGDGEVVMEPYPWDA